MFNVFNITYITADYTNKLVNIKFNFTVDDTTVNKKTVNIIDSSSGLPVTYKLSVKDETVTLVLKEWPSINTEYIVNIDGVKDKLNRDLNHALSKTIIFESDTKLKNIITCPNNNEAVRKLHNLIYFSIKVIGEDGKETTNPMPGVGLPELPTGFDLEQAILEDESKVIYHFEFASDIAFFDVVKDYKSEYTDGNIELNNGQYYMRARVIEDDLNGDWSEVITFTVVPDICEDLLTEEDSNYIDDIMAPIEFFMDGDTKFEIESTSSNGITHNTIYLELSKEIDITKLPQTIVAYRREL